jgi:hypothetical protein
MSVSSTQSVMDRYFAVMGAAEDFSPSFDDDVTWLMVDNGHEVRGPGPVRDYILELHGKISSMDSRPLVVTDRQAFLEAHSINADQDAGSGLNFCLVYDVSDDHITAMRCYGNVAALMPRWESTAPTILPA